MSGKSGGFFASKGYKNLMKMVYGYGASVVILGALFKINIQNKVTIMVEVGLQNTALALLIAGNILKNADMQKPAMVYAMITFFSTLIFAWLIKTTSLKFFDKSKSA